MAEKKAKKAKGANSKTLAPENPSIDKKKKSQRSKTKAKREERRGRKNKSGPRLPASLTRELNLLGPQSPDSDGDFSGGEEGGDVYEFEEETPQEESKKNRRFDPVANYEPELPDDFMDEEIPSDDDGELESEPEDEEEDGDRHRRMLEGITGMPGEAFNGKVRKVDLSDVQGNLDGGQISIQDLLDPLHGKPGYSNLRKRVHQLERRPMAVQAPLPKVERERVERKVAYEQSKKDITKWEPLVKRNREAPTLFFEEDSNLGYSTVGAIASEFEPRTEFEKKMATLVRAPEVMEAHLKDGARLLELNKISAEEVKDRQNRLAKMRSLLFRHEMKSKHIKKIKSKTFHRLLKKDKMKAAAPEMQLDPEAAKEYAMKQEFKRAEERLTLKHKNSSKWAKRILKRGLNVQDEGTRTAVAEQLNQHALLTRKMNSMKDSSSSEDSSDDDDDEDFSPGSDSERASKLLNRAKEKTLKVIEEEDETPESGVLALPFMKRGLQKRKEEAYEEAHVALQEYDSSLGYLEDDNVAGNSANKASGRKVFGPDKKQPQESSKRIKLNKISRSSDSEDDFEDTEHGDDPQETNKGAEEVQIGTALIDDETMMGQQAVFKNFADIIKDPGPKTSYEVAIFASDTWKKMKSEKTEYRTGQKSETVKNAVLPIEDLKALDGKSDSESEDEMVDGFLSSGAKPSYELPSQADLIHRAFAGDDVEAEFDKDKLEVLNEENPEPEKPVLLPGWGQWTHVQQKKGMPSWMMQEHESAKRKREEALKKRKDAHLKHVIISEKIDKKAEKLQTKTLPFPYKSKEIFEQSIRMPIGPEYNPAISVGALNRPAVVKRAGVMIKPIQYEEVDPHEKPDEPKRIVQKTATKKSKGARGKPTKKASGKKGS